MNKHAFIFPGQGEQYPGMGKDFFEGFHTAKEIFQNANDILHFDLTKIIFSGSEDELKKTVNSQLSVFVCSCAILAALKDQFPTLRPFVCAGLSLGEYSALFAADKIRLKDALLLIRKRATYMNESCEKHKGTMAAVLGLESNLIEEIVSKLSAKKVWAANFNTPAQTVISGSLEGVEAAKEALIKAGAKKIIPLQVQGAFHSGLMKDAQDKLEKDMAATEFFDSPTKIVMNATGKFAAFQEIKKNLIIQVTSSVRWCQSIKTMDEDGTELYIEIGPGKTLTNMNKRIEPKGLSLNIEKISDLEKIGQLSI